MSRVGSLSTEPPEGRLINRDDIDGREERERLRAELLQRIVARELKRRAVRQMPR